MRALLCLTMLAGAAGADDKPKSPPAKVDWGAFSDHIKVAGVVEKVSDTGFTLKILKGVKRGRPPEPIYEEVDLQYHESAQIRVPKLPQKVNEAGKKVNYTEKERAALKTAAGRPRLRGRQGGSERGRESRGATAQAQGRARGQAGDGGL